MYDVEIKGWWKHWDFLLLDIICSEVSFFLASLFILQLKNYSFHDIYRNEAILIIFGLILQVVFFSPYKGILRRSTAKEVAMVARSTGYQMVINLGFLFFLHIIHDMSRKVFVLTWILYMVLACIGRYCLKRYLLHRVAGIKDAKAFVIITDPAHLSDVVEELSGDLFRNLFIEGAFLDGVDKASGKEEVPVLGNAEDACEYILQNWVDEVFLYLPENLSLQRKLVSRLREMGVPVHSVAVRLDEFHKNSSDQHVDMFGRYVVLTYAIRVVSFGEKLVKRILDVIVGIVGCIVTGILFVIIGPMIRLASPGPVIFSQIRIGRNGKPFRMYKFRSMVNGAENQKEDLEKSNEVPDGMTFKITDDPRIISSGKKGRKGQPKGIGFFIRRTSIDEFPQFFNVLKGDMSIVGTRPPLPEEWEKYQFHHRARMGTRPGITGLWQISGRNDIVDFEEIVRLDAKYMRTWSLGLDLKIIALTIREVFHGEGR